MTVIERLRQYLEKTNTKVPVVEASTGIDAGRIHKWLQGKANPKHADTIKLEKFLKGDEVLPRGTLNEPEMQYKMNGSQSDYTAEYIQLLKDQLKTTQERLRFQEHLETLQSEIKKNRALLTTVLEHVAKVRASIEKKPLEKIQSEMGSTFFSALGLDGKTA